MARIAVVTDSTCDLDKATLEKYGIRMVPLSVHFEDEVLKDHVEISSEEFFARLPKERVIPRTAQPAPGEFLATYHALRDEGYEQVVSVHISQKLSGTYQSAQVARGMAEGIEVRVVDTQSASWGVGWCAIEAARAAAAGQSLDEVVARAEAVSARMQIFFVVDTLEYLEKNGRIGKAQAFLGTLLRFKPVLALEDGIIVPVERIRGRSRVLSRLVEIFEEQAEDAPNVVTVVHTQAEAQARELAARLQENPKVKSVNIGTLGPVIGCHVGPGVVGMSFYAPNW